jgi:CxxC-x17-CxxC domain-containing protein
MPFADRDVQCVSCGVMFVFSSGEQEFFLEKGFVNAPKRCKQCKARMQGGGGRRTIETHVTCSECGSDTTVPFKPTRGKPVLCRMCFANGPKPSNIVAAGAP